jgi:peptide/nickel transport system ATP-binding protein
MGLILITHDLGLAARYCDRIVVMKDGRIVEEGPPDRLFGHPEHPYTRRLVDATPRIGASIRSLLPPEARTAEPRHEVHGRPLLQVVDLVKTYPGQSGPVQAVRGISFEIKAGQSLGLVGESGSGKSTTSEMIVRLQDPTSGNILFDGQDIAATPASRFMRHPVRRDIQMVFQDATDSLNPRDTAASAIAEPLRRIAGLRGGRLGARVEELADLVGLPRPLLGRFPHQLSGGQKARVGIARAIALEPKLLVLDEPTAALDVSIQALVLNLLVDLRAQLGMSYLFVSHDLNVVRLLCDEVLVMKEGAVIEQGPAARIMAHPAHPYTRALVAAAPQPPAPAAA